MTSDGRPWPAMADVGWPSTPIAVFFCYHVLTWHNAAACICFQDPFWPCPAWLATAGHGRSWPAMARKRHGMASVGVWKAMRKQQFLGQRFEGVLAPHWRAKIIDIRGSEVPPLRFTCTCFNWFTSGSPVEDQIGLPVYLFLPAGTCLHLSGNWLLPVGTCSPAPASIWKVVDI